MFSFFLLRACLNFRLTNYFLTYIICRNMLMIMLILAYHVLPPMRGKSIVERPDWMSMSFDYRT